VWARPFEGHRRRIQEITLVTAAGGLLIERKRRIDFSAETHISKTDNRIERKLHDDRLGNNWVLLWSLGVGASETNPFSGAAVENSGRLADESVFNSVVVHEQGGTFGIVEHRAARDGRNFSGIDDFSVGGSLQPRDICGFSQFVRASGATASEDPNFRRSVSRA